MQSAIRALEADVSERLEALLAHARSGANRGEVAVTLASEVEHIRSTTAALRELVALHSGGLRLARVEVSDTIIEALARWKKRTPTRTFELAMPGREPVIIGDATRIQHALDALIAWANAHSSAGDIRVSLLAGHGHTGAPGLWGTQRPIDDGVVIAVRSPLNASTLTADDLFPRVAHDAGAAEQPRPQAVELLLAQAVAERHGGTAWAEVSPEVNTVTLMLSLPATPHLAAEPPASRATKVGAEQEEGTLPVQRAKRVALVAHSDARLARYLRANLDAAGYKGIAASTLDAALKLIDVDEPDIILLDVTLADPEERDPLTTTLARVTTPVIALGMHADPAVCVAALDAGAADYISQPFSLEEIVARTRRALRPAPGRTDQPRSRIFTCGDLVIDDTQRSVTKSGAPVGLSKTEYRLLRALAQHMGKTLSHEALLEQVWGPAYSHEIEFIWVYIRRLRRKIESDPANPCYIVTAPGVGYRLSCPVTPRPDEA